MLSFFLYKYIIKYGCWANYHTANYVEWELPDSNFKIIIVSLISSSQIDKD